jgi:hypothetical protein
MKKIMFTPADNNHLEEFKKFENSLRKFHSEEELPLIRVDNTTKDPHFWYRAKPVIAKDLIDEYEIVIGADCDQIILAPLNEIWEGNFDVAVVNNDPSWPIQVWDMTHPFIVNNGLVVLKSKEFINHWYRLCMSEHFLHYQYREQDFLTMLCSDYFSYNVRWLDRGPKAYGEVAKPLWAQFRMNDNKVMLGDKQLCVIHFGGGAEDPSKGNYKIRFSEDVVKYIESLINANKR